MQIPEPQPIREYEKVDRRIFLEEIRPAGQPAVLRGLASDWPAVQAARISHEAFVSYLKRFAVARPVAALIGPPEIKGRFFYSDDLTRLNFTRGFTPLGPFLDRLLEDRTDPEPYAIAVQSEQIAELLPGFETENRIDLPPAGTAPRAWMGNCIRVAAHYDLMENIGCVVAGRRRFTLFPPEELGNLYPGPFELTPAGTPISLVDLENPDLVRFPRFAAAAAAAQRAELAPGDAIYVPFHWWHAVDSLEPVNLFVNYWWNDAQPGIGNPYDALIYAFFALKPLPEEQRRVWRMIFDHYIFQTEGEPGRHLPPHVRGILGPTTPEHLERLRATLKQMAATL